MPKRRRQDTPTTYVPDGAEIRGLIDRAQGATRLSLAEALLPAGARPRCITRLSTRRSGTSCRGQT